MIARAPSTPLVVSIVVLLNVIYRDLKIVAIEASHLSNVFLGSP